MDRKKLTLVIGAAVMAIGTGLAAKSMLSGKSSPVPMVQAIVVPKGPKVLVAQRALPVGTIITADAVSFQQWPKDMLRDAYFVDGAVNMNKLLGTVVRYPITAGQPLTQGALVAPGDRGFLAAALTPGMRAITIPVSDKSSVAGFIFPGDRVDLMLTQTLHGVGQEAGPPLNVTETIVRNLRVLATDQSPGAEAANGKTVVKTFHLVTLEATPQIAQKIEVAQTIGAIDMTLRPIADNQAELDHVIASGKVKLGDNATSADEGAMLNQMQTAPTAGAGTFSTGGDVSRFQRRSTPPLAIPVPKPGVKVVRGNDVSDSGANLAGANGALTGQLANGASNAGATVGATTPAALAGG